MARRLIAALALGLAACDERYTDSCFAGPTLISTPRGRRRIRDLIVGDEVWSFDPVEKRFAVGIVGAIHCARGEVRSVRTPRGAIGAVTASHPLFIASREAFAADLKLGETLLVWDDDPATQPVTTPVLAFAAVAPGDPIEVFNLTVEGAFSTYFADGFFVHNKSREMTCEEWRASATVSVKNPQLCIGESTPITVDGPGFMPSGCPPQADFQKSVVLATSNPAVLGIEQRNAIGRGAGTATVTVLLDGREAATASVDVRDCFLDAGTDTGVGTDATADASDARSDASVATDADAAD